MMERLARLVIRHRLPVVGAWILLTAFGAFSAAKVSNRWLESFSIPGYSAYESNQRALKTFGNGEQAPLVAVFRSTGDVTKQKGIANAVAAGGRATRGSRTSSYFSTGSDAYVSRDRHTTFAEIYPAGQGGFNSGVNIKQIRARIQAATPAGVTAHLTGRDPIYEAASSDTNGPSILGEALIGGFGALIILLFVFGTLPAVAMPLLVAIASILNTFTLVWIVTYITDVSIIVQFLIALVGLGVAIDYALVIIFRFREELRHGRDTEAALVLTMRHAGRSVIVSGSTVAVGLLSMILLPLPFIRSIGVGGMLIPAVSVLASITLLPAMLSILGPRINRVRVMPRRIVEGTDAEAGFWNRWAQTVVRRPLLIAGIGTAICAALLYYGVQLNPSEAQVKDLPGAGDAIVGRQAVADAGISAGIMKPFQILVEGGATPARLKSVVSAVTATPGVAGAAAPAQWRRGGTAIVEAFPAADGAARSMRPVISNLQDKVLPGLQNGGSQVTLGGVAAEDGAAPATKTTISRLQHDVLPKLADETELKVTLGGSAAADRDFVRAVYGNFPYVLLFVVLLTYVLLARAFRSLLLPLKAVILNLVSLGAAFGIVVFIFQIGHGSQAIWGVHPTQSIIAWIPLMIFAFLYGLSMDYEVFMLTRMREAYDETGDTPRAIGLGLARTGKLVTSAALVLCLAFFVLSTSPGTDIKQFGIGLSAGILFDATVIRALLVPSLMRLLGKWNWWLPAPVARVLRVRPAPSAA
ncbi:MAG: putative drug exporter of the superfamily [Gaiellaceae bacterium]|nr:putative drug exporter of the superfamily [Gaiellaceae bacterium]